jgi:hypothetical protein
MHWFDRFSRQMAEPRVGATTAAAPATTAVDAASSASSTRRTVLKGATLAAFTLPFAPQLAGRAAAAGVAGTATRAGGAVEMPPGYETLESVSEFCSNCMTRSYGKHDSKWKACGASANPKPFLKPKGKGGGGGKGATKKSTPSKAAKQLACQAKVIKSLDKELQQCRMHFCEGDSEPPTPPTPGVEANPNPTCPSGTTICSKEMCCYGGDACCVCATTGGFICCAGVIGCACC